MATASRLYSSQEAASELNLTDGRIRQICRWSGGKIGRKMGRDWWLADADLEIIRIKFRKKSDSDENDG